MESGQLLIGFILLLVTFMALGPIKAALLGDKPEVHGSILTADTSVVWIVVSNDGNGPAALSGIRITANIRGTSSWDEVFKSTSVPDRILKPGDLTTIPLTHHHRIPEIAVAGEVDAPKSCLLIIEYVELGGVHVSELEYFRCHPERRQ